MGLGLRVEGRVYDLGGRVPGFKVQSLGLRIWGSGFRF